MKVGGDIQPHVDVNCAGLIAVVSYAEKNERQITGREREMKFVELFAGIGGFRLGLERAGHQCVWANEIDKKAVRYYNQKWPDGIMYEGDICKVSAADLPKHDLIVGGFPCQDLSIAGKHKGLAGNRSGLFFQIIRLVKDSKPEWVLLENVPNLLSSNEGRDMEIVLRSMADLGYWWTYRVLDSQHFGIPQRRRRLFIVYRLGKPCPPTLLLDEESCLRNAETDSQVGEVGLCVTTREGARQDPTVETVIASTITSTPRGSPRYLWSETIIAETDRNGNRKVHGVSSRNDRVRCLGNAVVPQVVEWIGKRLNEV